jgi:hypothetical protein
MWTAANQAYPLEVLAKDYIIRLQVDFVDLYTIAMIAQNALSAGRILDTSFSRSR